MDTDRSMLIPQLRKIWVRDGNLNTSHVLVSIVRLTIETNLVTSTCLGVLDAIMCPLKVSRSFSYCQFCSIADGCPVSCE